MAMARSVAEQLFFSRFEPANEQQVKETALRKLIRSWNELDEAQREYLSRLLDNVVGSERKLSLDDSSEWIEVVQGIVPDWIAISDEEALKWLRETQRAVQSTANLNDEPSSSYTSNSVVPEAIEQSKVSPLLEIEGVQQLAEVFPDISRDKIISVLSKQGGDIDQAARILLDTRPNKPLHPLPNGFEQQTDEELKQRIVSSYFIETVTLTKTGEEHSHKPVLRTKEEKKNVRYRDNKVVSDQDEDDVNKATAVHLRPLRAYRFN